MRRRLGQLALLVVLASVLASIFAPRFGIRPNDVFGAIIILSVISASVTGLRMRRKVRRVLGRKATEGDLTSINTWMEVDQEERRTGEGKLIEETHHSQDHLESVIAGAEVGIGGTAESSLLSHQYPAVGFDVVPMTFGAGKFGYALMILLPVIGIWLIGPANLTRAPWLRWALVVYAAGAVFAMLFLLQLKLEIRTDGIGYASMFSENTFVLFSEMSSAVILTDPHSRLSLWPAFTLHDFVITPRPETNKATLKIPLLLFPLAAREALIHLLRPEEIDVGA